MEQELKLEITSGGFENLPRTIETNIARVAEAVKAECAFARELAVDPNSITDIEFAEKRAAHLRKGKSELARFRLNLSRQWSAPLAEFETACKTLEKEVGESADILFGKAKEGRNIARELKCQSVRLMWNNRRASYGFATEKDIPYLDQKFAEMTNDATKGCWTNRGAKDADTSRAMDEILSQFAKAVSEFEKISGTAEATDRAFGFMAIYDEGDLASAVLAMTNHKSQRERDAKIAKEAEKARDTASGEPDTEKDTASEQNAQQAISRALVEDEPLETYRLAITGTRANLVALRQFGEAHGIKFSKIN